LGRELKAAQAPGLVAVHKRHILQGRSNWERYEGSQTAGVQAVLGFPAQSGVNNAKTADSGDAAPDRTIFTLDEIETKVNSLLASFCFFHCP